MWDLSPLNKWEFRGPEALEASQRVHTNDVVGMRDGQVRYGAFVDEDGLVVDDGTVFRRPEHAAAVWEAVEDAGAIPYGVDIIEPVRVETGMIVTDYDYEPQARTPFDLGLDRLVALDGEGDFMGKEQLRAVAADPPNRFVTIRLEGETLPEYGAAMTSGDDDAGVLTSPAMSPTLGPLGLAIVPTSLAAPGTAVEVAMP